MSTSNDTRGRPRDPGLEDRILEATRALLVDHGYSGTTVDAVAAAAGCGKSAIYRRWPGKAQLVVAAVKQLQTAWPVPDTGSLREDVLGCALHYTRADDRASTVLARLLVELGREPELYEIAFPTIGRPPVAAMIAVIERWKDAGVVPAAVPAELLARIVPSIAFGSISIQNRALDVETVTQIVDDVLLPALTAR